MGGTIPQAGDPELCGSGQVKQSKQEQARIQFLSALD